MPTITPHLWYDTQAIEAAKLYTSTFANSRIVSQSVIEGTPSGDVDTLTIELEGQRFSMISAGPYFKFNPSISFLVACESKEEVDRLWDVLAEGGKALMELGSYPFSERYGWTEDRYGLSWQIMYMGELKAAQKITPTLMFVGDMCGKAEEAIDFYVATFHGSRRGGEMRYGEGEEPDKAGTLKHAGFTLENYKFAAMDSAHNHQFAFNEAISFMVNCDTQAELDYYWEKLSAVPEAEQCGWLKDKFGVSWQIVPAGMEELMSNPDREKVNRVTQAFLKMKKIDMKVLEEASKA